MFFMFQNLLVTYYQLVNYLKTLTVVSFFPNLTVSFRNITQGRFDSAKLIDGLYFFEDEESKNKEAQGFSNISTQVKDQIML